MASKERTTSRELPDLDIRDKIKQELWARNHRGFRSRDLKLFSDSELQLVLNVAEKNTIDNRLKIIRDMENIPVGFYFEEPAK